MPLKSMEAMNTKILAARFIIFCTTHRTCPQLRRRELSDVLEQNNPRLLDAFMVARLSLLVQTGDYLMDKSEMLPCPFCGDSEHGEMQMTYMHADGETKGRRIKCNTCGAMAQDTIWNTRTHHTEIKAMARDAERYVKIRTNLSVCIRHEDGLEVIFVDEGAMTPDEFDTVIDDYVLI